MRKFIIAMVALVATVATAVGADKPAPEYYTNLEQVVENAIKRGSMGVIDPKRIDPAKDAWVDETVAAASNVVIASNWNRWPKSVARYLESVKETRPLYYAFNKEGLDSGHVPYTTYCNKSPIKWVNMNLENGWNMGRVEVFKKRAISYASRYVKRQIRDEGKTFVVDGDKNPVQTRLDALTKSLDSPLFAGYREAFAACGIPVTADFNATVPPLAEREKMVDDVFHGDLDFNRFKDKLILHLGVDGFNDFVKRYNSDAK